MSSSHFCLITWKWHIIEHAVGENFHQLFERVCHIHCHLSEETLLDPLGFGRQQFGVDFVDEGDVFGNGGDSLKQKSK